MAGLPLDGPSARVEADTEAMARSKAQAEAEVKQLMKEYLDGSTIHGLRRGFSALHG
jgi:hypothetical protein